MSRITSIANGNGLVSFGLNDGSVFHMSNTNHKGKCTEAFFGSSDDSDSAFHFDADLNHVSFSNGAIRVELQDASIITASKLSDDNFEICHLNMLNETDSGCSTADKNKEDNREFFAYISFFNDHEAYTHDGCTLFVTHNNCTEVLF